MKFWRWFYSVIGWLLVIGLGSGAIFMAQHRFRSLQEIDDFVRILGRINPWAFWSLGVGLLLLGLTTLLSPLSRVRRQRLLEFPTESGRVQVDITALEDCLAHVVSEEQGVVRARVNLRG
ncbi:MAG: hypothetical protein ACK2U9_05250, partial [Anaerolineae bacterium]